MSGIRGWRKRRGNSGTVSVFAVRNPVTVPVNYRFELSGVSRDSLFTDYRPLSFLSPLPWRERVGVREKCRCGERGLRRGN